MLAEMASRRNVTAVRRLTQEELLEEAKDTEKQVGGVDGEFGDGEFDR
jgi:hypothetical protein